MFFLFLLIWNKFTIGSNTIPWFKPQKWCWFPLSDIKNNKLYKLGLSYIASDYKSLTANKCERSWHEVNNSIQGVCLPVSTVGSIIWERMTYRTTDNLPWPERPFKVFFHGREQASRNWFKVLWSDVTKIKVIGATTPKALGESMALYKTPIIPSLKTNMVVVASCCGTTSQLRGLPFWEDGEDILAGDLEQNPLINPI